MLAARRYWGAITVINAVGAGLVFVGAETSIALQASGFLFLLPGSLVAAALPLQRLWNPALWYCCRTDATGLSNVLYLPLAVAVNLLTWWAIRAYRIRRGTARLSSQ